MSLNLMRDLLNIDIADTTKDTILEHCLNRAKQSILNYLNIDVLDVSYNSVVVDYAVYLYNNKNNTGLISKRQGERSINIEKGIPDSIKQSLPLPRIRVIG